ncbi:tRNA-specific 2-thiouridylase MnmA [Clostridia bacterium]|nr:tRNA-specific 2-thiouridylase MnmA [Clostridia bacterium]
MQGNVKQGTAGRALIAMSGGVDSSVAAMLLLQAGYECVGVTMKLFVNEDSGGDPNRPCCSLAGAADAARVCADLGIPHYVFDFTEEFRRDVMERFVTSYERGVTPSPCIDCNEFLKFGRLLERARQMGFDKVVTGHYAVIESPGAGGDGRFLLKRAADQTKDQTYFLYSMTQDQLAHACFPLGRLTKPEVRKLASEAGFTNAAKAESQDICFVTQGGYAEFIEHYRGEVAVPGFFVDGEGRKLGRHRGIVHYTIGQRKGLGIALGRPVFVKEIRPETNEVVLADEADVFTDRIVVSELNWIADNTEGTVPAVFSEVAIRYGATPALAKIEAGTDPSWVTVVFCAPVRAPAKGQAAVFYKGDTVLGGGRIRGVTAASAQNINKK